LKYTIEGLRQDLLVKWGLDATDAVIIRWFADFYHTSRMKPMVHEGKEYKWLRYQHVIDDLPAVGVKKDRDAIAKRFKGYVACGLMDYYLCKEGGNYTYFRLNEEKWVELVSDPSPAITGEVPRNDREAPPQMRGTNYPSSNPSSRSRKTLGSPEAHPEIRKVTDYYQELFTHDYGTKPTWDGKIIKLVKADVARLGVELLNELVWFFFEYPPEFVKKNATGMGYNIFHSMIDGLLEKKRRMEGKPA